MKSWKGVTLEKIADIGNLKKARYYAGRRKEKRPYVYKFQEQELLCLQADILNNTYHVSPGYEFDIVDSFTNKKRHIVSPHFRDQVLHHAIIQVMEPYLLKHFHTHSLASIKGRGIEKGRKLLHKWSCHNRNKSKWVLKGDIRKYYDNVNIKLLLRKLSKHIKDSRVVELIRRVLNADVGLCLGSYIAQWMANLYLTDYLHAAYRLFRISHILCYMDNLTFILSAKRVAKKLLAWSIQYLSLLGLKLKLIGKEAVQMFRWKYKPIDAVGYKSYFNGFQKVRGHIYLAVTRMMNKIRRVDSACRRQARSLLSRYGFIKHSSSVLLRQRLEVFISQYGLKELAKWQKTA